MARSRRAGKASPARADGPVAGSYPIDTGIAELSTDPVSGGWLLQIDGAYSSLIHPDDPSALDFEYLRYMAAVIEDRFGDRQTLRALHVGGAACALARHLDAHHAGARQVAVEVDAELARLVREWFALPRAPRLRIRVGDGREVTAGLQPQTRDVIVRDAFIDGHTPAHLRTVEAVREVARVLAPDGLYLANCGDDRSLVGARADVATIGAVFDEVLVIADPAMLKGRRHGNVVVVAAQDGLAASAALRRRLLSDPQPAQILDPAQARTFGASAEVLLDPATSTTSIHDDAEKTS